MARILILRHAATDWSTAKRIQGRTDRPLSAVGRQQAQRWQLPGRWRSAECLCSPLTRAIETADLLGLSYRIDDRLIETDWGAFEGERLSDLRANPALAMAELEAAGIDFRPPGGESPREVAARIASLLQATNSTPSHQIWITHKGVRRASLILAAGWLMQDKPPIRVSDDQGLVLNCQPGAPPGVEGVIELNSS